jgi:rubrerythrin
MQNKNEALSVLGQAIENEEEGRALYLEAAQRTGDQGGQRMFRSLAEDEEEHKHILLVEYASLNEGKGWVDVAAAKNEAPPASALRLFPPQDKAKKRFTKDTSDLEAMEAAMEYEQRGYRMYQAAEEATSDPTAKSVLHFLVEEESRHYKLLSNSHDYLKEKGKWYFDDLERPFFEG